MLTENLTLVTTKDAVQIAVWEIFDSKKSHQLSIVNANKGQNIFLTHGTFSEKKTCLRMAEYLAGLWHHCYIMEWRGHGASSLPTDKFNFETVATYDFAATFDYLLNELKLSNLHCVTHSGGGACLTMFLIQNPQYIARINSISMFACQVYGAIVNPKNYFKIIAAKLFTRLFGYIPAKKLKLGPINESHHTMNQWYEWNLHKNFHSSFIQQNDIDANGIQKSAFDSSARQQNTIDGAIFDYRQYMPNITIPIYAISAKGDKFISPTQGCLSLFNDFNESSNNHSFNNNTLNNNALNKNSANVFREYARSSGDLDDYTHSRILNSRTAAKEIWPTVAAWIEQHAG
ncbi:alpha/beta fold hydrolase [Psychrobacter faecalis]|jgi:pimeloyl-ACP methyl ester carboxylesterase|uniref:alpha/beta fold hydrolase n=1 Tax=Psychrobacter faecalis TaxID=180588 RepID=UPI00259AB4A1|nr:alpha/beta fold hydrolase [uncultured Psychrobacter sp.]